MPHDFYVVLGISRDADLDQIKRAYRKLVKRYHPDTSSQQPEKFLEVQQAYETLREEHSRREHDRATRQPPDGDNVPIVVRTRRGPVARRRGAASIPEDLRKLSSAVDEFFSGWIPGVFNGGRAARHKDLYVELILEPAEARGGGLFPLQVPAEVICPDCGGTGLQGELSCATCRGEGRTMTYHPIQVSVPPGVADGTSRRLALDDIGLPGVDLVVLVTVNP